MEECNYCGVDIDNGTNFCTKCSDLFEWHELRPVNTSIIKSVNPTINGPLIIFNNSYITKHDTISRLSDKAIFRLSGSLYVENGGTTVCYLLYMGDNLIVESPKVGDEFEVIYRMYAE